MNMWPLWITRHGPIRLVLYLLTYISLIMALRLLLFPGGADDDGEILYYTQSWGFSYKSGQPPLYAWLIMAVQAIAGPSMTGVVLVKYCLLALFYGFSYLAARRLLRDKGFALAAPFGLIACYFIGWETVVSYSHTVLVMTAMAATLWLVLRLEDRHETRDYLWLAMAMAGGMLAKYNFTFFLLPLLCAAWSHPILRLRVFSIKFAAGFGAAVLFAIGPMLISWIGGMPKTPDQVSMLSQLFPVVDGRLLATAHGLFQFLLATLGLLSPFLLIAIILFPGACHSLSRPDDSLISAGRFLETYLAVLLAVSIVAILLFAVSDVRNNWLVVWFPAVFYILLRIKVYTSGDDGRAALGRVRWFCGLLIVIAMMIPAGLIGRGMISPNSCDKCNFFIPYKAMAEAIRGVGFVSGTIVAQDYPNQLAGNLRRYFPTARVISTRWRDYPSSSINQVSDLDPNGGVHGKCLLIWRGDSKASGGGETRAEAAKRLGLKVPVSAPVQTISLTLPRSSGRTLSWSYHLLEPAENCR